MSLGFYFYFEYGIEVSYYSLRLDRNQRNIMLQWSHYTDVKSASAFRMRGRSGTGCQRLRSLVTDDPGVGHARMICSGPVRDISTRTLYILRVIKAAFRRYHADGRSGDRDTSLRGTHSYAVYALSAKFDRVTPGSVDEIQFCRHPRD